MKKLLSVIAAIATLSAIGAETRTLTFQWDHDGLNTTGFRLWRRDSTNAVYSLAGITGPTNRTMTITLTNPPPFVQFSMTATNALLESDMSTPVSLSEPTVPGTLRIITVVTVQTP